MRVLLVSRYPKVDTPPWKRIVASGLADADLEAAVLYSRSRLLDQALAGLGQYGSSVVREYFRRDPRGRRKSTPRRLPHGPRNEGLP